MNCCFGGNRCLWILIILRPLLAALAYCMCKNGTLQSLVNSVCGSGDGCGCN